MQIEENYDVKNLTSFKCGGKIKKVYFPESMDEFIKVLLKEPDIKVFGNLTNTLVSSDGYDGIVIITTKMSNYLIKDTTVKAECGLKGPKLAQAAAANGLSGLEFMVAFPGSVGGEVYMNAGAHGQSISDVLIAAECYDKEQHKILTFTKEKMNFSYRSSICQKFDLVVLSAIFQLKKALKGDIEERMKDNLLFRHAKQPSLALANCGSVFKNPVDESAGRLLDAAGVKGLVIGGAAVWKNHANFIINDKSGTSTDILEVMHVMYNQVKEKFGVELVPEVRYLGGKNEKEVKICKELKMI